MKIFLTYSIAAMTTGIIELFRIAQVLEHIEVLLTTGCK